MAAVEQHPPTFQFGAFELNPHTRELRKHGVKLKLQDQPLEALLVLLEHPGEVVTREEIRKRLWAEDTYVDFDNAINSSIRKLREVLGDTADNPRFVETVSRRGYRFIAPVSVPAAPRQMKGGGPDLARQVLPMRGRFRLLLVAVLVSIAGIGVLYKQALDRGRSASDDVAPPVPLTSYPGFQWSPAFSPDGTRIAFTWDEPGKRDPDIYIKLIGPTDPVRLTSDSGSHFAPAWSPDGRWIAFFQTKGPFETAVMLIPSLGGPARELARLQLHAPRLTYHGWWDASPPFIAWSPDGKWLLTLEQSESEKPTRETPLRGVRISVESGEKRAFPPLLNADQNQRRERSASMEGEEGLAISPDGTKLAFIHAVDYPNTGIFVVPLNKEAMPSGAAASLHFDNSLCRGIAWDTDGRSLIVSSNRRGSFELWRVPVSHSAAPSPIHLSDSSPVDLAIDKAGDRLAYTHLSYDLNIWRVDLTSDGLKDAAALINSTRDEFHPNYSMDGQRIAFESDRFGNQEIWVSNTDGSRAVQVTRFGNAWAGSPRWSPDGQQIAFDCNAAGQWDVYVIPSQGGKATRLTSGSGSKIRPSWSHDGKSIYYCAPGDSAPQVWKKDAKGGREMQVTKNGGCNPMESPDGRYLYYLKSGDRYLARVPVNGGEEASLLQMGPNSQFTVGTQGVYFIDSADANTLKFRDHETGTIKTLGSLPGPALHGLSVSPDEHWLLYGKGESGGSQLMLLERFR